MHLLYVQIPVAANDSGCSLHCLSAGGSLAPAGSALLWADPAAAAGGSAAASGADSVPHAAWQELGASHKKEQQQHISRLVQHAWRFLDRMHSSAAAAAADALAPPRSPVAALLRLPRSSSNASDGRGQPARRSLQLQRGGSSGLGGAAPVAAVGVTDRQLWGLEQQRGLLLLQRLLLLDLRNSPPEVAQQAAAQAAQLLPLLLADAAADPAAAEAATARLQLLLSAV